MKRGNQWGGVRVLVVEDDEGDFALLSAAIDKVEYDVELTHVTCLKDALKQPPHDANLLDLGLPDSEGPEGLIRLQEAFPEVPVVVLTGTDDPRIAKLVVRAGASDFITKSGRDMKAVLHSLRFAVHQRDRPPKRRAASVLEGVQDPDSIDYLLRIVNDAAMAGPVVLITTRHPARKLRRRWLDGQIDILDATGHAPEGQGIDVHELDLLEVLLQRAVAKAGSGTTVLFHVVEDIGRQNLSTDVAHFVRNVAGRMRKLGARVRYLVGPGPLHDELGRKIRPHVDEVRSNFDSSKMGHGARNAWT